MDAPPLLSLRISVDYPGKPGVLRDLALDVGRQEILGLVGQSGCGKSTLSLAILKLLYLKRAQARGSIHFNGRDLMALGRARSSISARKRNRADPAESDVVAESRAAHWHAVGRGVESPPERLGRTVPAGVARSAAKCQPARRATFSPPLSIAIKCRSGAAGADCDGCIASAATAYRR